MMHRQWSALGYAVMRVVSLYQFEILLSKEARMRRTCSIWHLRLHCSSGLGTRRLFENVYLLFGACLQVSCVSV